jgi:hypothetical protein
MRRLAWWLFALGSAVSLGLCLMALALMALPDHGDVVGRWDRPDGYGVEAVSYGDALYVHHGHANRTLTVVSLEHFTLSCSGTRSGRRTPLRPEA